MALFRDRRALTVMQNCKTRLKENVPLSLFYLQKLVYNNCITELNYYEICLRQDPKERFEKLFIVLLRRLTRDVFYQFLLSLSNSELKNHLIRDYQEIGGLLPETPLIEEYVTQYSSDISNCDSTDAGFTSTSYPPYSRPASKVEQIFARKMISIPSKMNWTDVSLITGDRKKELFFTNENGMVLVSNASDLTFSYLIRLPTVWHQMAYAGHSKDTFVFKTENGIKMVKVHFDEQPEHLQDYRGQSIPIYASESINVSLHENMSDISSTKAVNEGRMLAVGSTLGHVSVYSLESSDPLTLVSQFTGILWGKVSMSFSNEENALLAWSPTSNRVRIASFNSGNVASRDIFRFKESHPRRQHKILHCILLSRTEKRLALITEDRWLLIAEAGRIIAHSHLNTIATIEEMVYNGQQESLYIRSHNAVLIYDRELKSFKIFKLSLVQRWRSILFRRLFVIDNATILVESFSDQNMKIHWLP